MLGGWCADCLGGIFIQLQCDNSRKRGPEKGMTCPGSQGKSVAHTGLDADLLNLLSKWTSHVQTEFQAWLLPGQTPLSSCTVAQPHQVRGPGAQRVVSHLPFHRVGEWAPFADSWGWAHFALVVPGRGQATPNRRLPLNTADFWPSLVGHGGWDPH